jgi:Iap family predicted aminopeptidase
VIEARLRRFKGKDAERRITLMRLFEEAGCRDGHLLTQPVTDADAPNVICSLPGSTDRVIVVGAHFDRVDAGDGVADNWSGASLLPSLYQSLSAKMRRHTFLFIGFSDEEEGFVGSRFYVERLNEDALKSIQAMINLDTLGLESMKIWASDSDPRLVALMNDVARSMQLPVDVMNIDGIGNSDGISFKKHDIPIITLHSVTLDNLHILHSREDRFSIINLGEYYNAYNLISGYLTALDQR